MHRRLQIYKVAGKDKPLHIYDIKTFAKNEKELEALSQIICLFSLFNCI